MKLKDLRGSYVGEFFDFRSIREMVSNVLLICTAYTASSGEFSGMPDYTIPEKPNYGITSRSDGFSTRKTGKSLSTLANS